MIYQIVIFCGYVKLPEGISKTWSTYIYNNNMHVQSFTAMLYIYIAQTTGIVTRNNQP